MQHPLSQRLKNLIDLIGANRNQIAKAADIDYVSFTRAVEGKAIPRFDMIEKLYITFPKIDSRYLLTGDGDPLPKVTSKDDRDLELEHLREKVQLLEEIVTLQRLQLQASKHQETNC